MKKGSTGPFIIVAADGYRDSMWADSVDGTQPAETDVIKQIIPYVDANFRTVADPRRRVVQGFSMGGFGATTYAAKFPNTFSAAVSFEGALHTWSTLVANREELAMTVFGSEAYFDDYSPYTQATLSATRERASEEAIQDVAYERRRGPEGDVSRTSIIRTRRRRPKRRSGRPARPPSA